MKQEIEAAIRAAWASPIMNQWNPNKNPTCVATVKRNRPPNTSPGGLILPASALPLLPKAGDKPVEYKVAFAVAYATVAGKPAFQITGSCQGVNVIVKQGYLARAGRMPEAEGKPS
jgi:hypothetical protein